VLEMRRKKIFPDNLLGKNNSTLLIEKHEKVHCNIKKLICLLFFESIIKMINRLLFFLMDLSKSDSFTYHKVENLSVLAVILLDGFQ
jgi:hypothetical protein